MNVCPACFNNSALERRIAEIRPTFPDGVACERHPSRKGIPLAAVANIIDPGLRANYGIGEWMFDDQEGNDLYTVIADTTGAEDDDVIQGIIEWLIDNDSYWPPDGEEAFYAEDQSYVLIQPNGWHHSMLWRQFREEILHRQRFFSEQAKKFLAEIFGGIQNQSDISGKPAFYRLEPNMGTELFRARMLPTGADYADISEAPAGQMGPPPPRLRRAGRMNAAGIRAFYGALERDTAVAELRPAVGSDVCIARFRLLRPLFVLDLTRFGRPGKQIDIFAKNQVVRAAQWAFMRSFATEISKPILPTDEHLEYVPPQVVAEYLTRQPIRWRGSEVIPDAIAFGSAQRPGGRNIAILGDSASVKPDEKKDSSSNVGADGVPFDYQGVFSSPLSRAAEPSLEYIQKSLERLGVVAATYETEVSSMSLLPEEQHF